MVSFFFSHRLGSSVTPLSLIRTVIGICWRWHGIDIVLLFFVLPLPTCLMELDSASSSSTYFAVSKAMSTWGSCIVQCCQSNWGDCTSSSISIKPQSLVIITENKNTSINSPRRCCCLQKEFQLLGCISFKEILPKPSSYFNDLYSLFKLSNTLLKLNIST